MNNNNKELWRPVCGYPNYEVSNHGHVYSKKRRHYISSTVNNNGFLQVGLYRNGHKKNVNIDNLVCIAFHGPPCDYFECYKVVHIDRNHQNNHASNLRWLTMCK